MTVKHWSCTDQWCSYGPARSGLKNTKHFLPHNAACVGFDSVRYVTLNLFILQIILETTYLHKNKCLIITYGHSESFAKQHINLNNTLLNLAHHLLVDVHVNDTKLHRFNTVQKQVHLEHTVHITIRGSDTQVQFTLSFISC